MSSLYFGNKVMFDKRLQAINPTIRGEVAELSRKRKKKARDKRKKKPGINKSLKNIDNATLIKLLLELLLGKKVKGKKDEDPVYEGKGKKKNMKLARLTGVRATKRGGYGLPNVRGGGGGGGKKNFDYGKKKDEPEKVYQTRVNSQLMEQYPQYVLFSQLMKSKNEAEANKVIEEISTGPEYQTLSRDFGKLLRFRKEFASDKPLTKARLLEVQKLTLSTLNAVEVGMVDAYLVGDDKRQRKRDFKKVQEGMFEAERELGIDGPIQASFKKAQAQQKAQPKQKSKPTELQPEGEAPPRPPPPPLTQPKKRGRPKGSKGKRVNVVKLPQGQEPSAFQTPLQEPRVRVNVERLQPGLQPQSQPESQPEPPVPPPEPIKKRGRGRPRKKKEPEPTEIIVDIPQIPTQPPPPGEPPKKTRPKQKGIPEGLHLMDDGFLMLDSDMPSSQPPTPKQGPKFFKPILDSVSQVNINNFFGSKPKPKSDKDSDALSYDSEYTEVSGNPSDFKISKPRQFYPTTAISSKDFSTYAKQTFGGKRFEKKSNEEKIDIFINYMKYKKQENFKDEPDLVGNTGLKKTQLFKRDVYNFADKKITTNTLFEVFNRYVMGGEEMGSVPPNTDTTAKSKSKKAKLIGERRAINNMIPFAKSVKESLNDEAQLQVDKAKARTPKAVRPKPVISKTLTEKEKVERRKSRSPGAIPVSVKDLIDEFQRKEKEDKEQAGVSGPKYGPKSPDQIIDEFEKDELLKKKTVNPADIELKMDSPSSATVINKNPVANKEKGIYEMLNESRQVAEDLKNPKPQSIYNTWVNSPNQDVEGSGSDVSMPGDFPGQLIDGSPPSSVSESISSKSGSSQGDYGGVGGDDYQP